MRVRLTAKEAGDVDAEKVKPQHQVERESREVTVNEAEPGRAGEAVEGCE